jgi:SAM-dependent methyltransferase
MKSLVLCGLRYVFHPIRGAKSIWRRAGNVVTQWQLARHGHHIRRAVKESCWCGGSLLPYRWHPSYGACARCGTYVNRRPPLAEELPKIYALESYWRRRQKLQGFPAIEARAELYRADGRLRRWLDLVEKYAAPTGMVIEIGCTPGVLLEELSRRNYRCLGVEVSEDVAEWIRQRTGLNILTGAFPDVDLPKCDVFLAFDVLEHSPCPKAFMQAVADCLLPNGVAILQTTIDRHQFTQPFAGRKDLFDDLEHTYLFTDRAMAELASAAGLAIVSLAESIGIGGEICVLTKPPVR